jgi:uncharacterized protein YlaI
MPTKKKKVEKKIDAPVETPAEMPVETPIAPEPVEPTPPQPDPEAMPSAPVPPVPEDKPMTVTPADEQKGNVDDTIGERIAVQVAQPVLPKAHSMPTIYAGKCEYCGESYKTCKHYRGIDVFCSYCGRKDVFDFRVINVKVLDNRPNELIFICADYKCQKAHKDKFTPSPLVR